MKTHTLPALNLPLDDSWDVLVLGGGPAGCAAAIAAAREGVRTLLVEGTGCLGGMGTLGLVPAWTPYSDQEKIIYRGLSEKIFKAACATMPHVPPGALEWVPIDPERLKQVYDAEVTGSGAKVLFHTRLAHVEAADGRVNTVILANKDGLTAVRAKVYVDGTGDGDLCAWAGAEFHKGDARGGKIMPGTLCFTLANVDSYAFQFGENLYPANPNSPIHKIMASGRFPLLADLHLCSNLIGPGCVGFNAGHIWLDGTDPRAVSDAMTLGRRIAQTFRDALAEFAPAAFGNAYLVNTAGLMGIRETRRVVCDYTLTLDDYLARRSFPDEIARNSYFIDIHAAQGEGSKNSDEFRKSEHRAVRYGKGETHGIPYRCLAPGGLRNVLVAGRAISCEQAVQGSVRVMPCCLTTGEAAGLAAAQLTAADRDDVHAADVNKLRARLRELGAYLP
ncbi:MAG: FAD-dependent oxidoreductase [Verrucomicrobiales bacterium]|jgi:glycine/D-amino acid oxidase-like deaminating enzyme|nr:FAD-dependent oxidoreductase [Verrucomicrobiales bacterium]